MEGERERERSECKMHRRIFAKKKEEEKEVHHYKCKVPFASIVLATALQKAKLVYLEIRGKRECAPSLRHNS